MSMADRFWEKVDEGDPDECWEWTGCISRYGRFGVGVGETYGAHRVALALTDDYDLDSEDWVCHTCHNKTCVNPNHLYAGSPKDNFEDARTEGDWEGPGTHFPEGEDNPSSKLTPEERDKIRERYENEDIYQQELADEYGVTQERVSAITRESA